MQNKIVYISAEKMDVIQQELQLREDVFIAEIDGKECTDMFQYLEIMSNIFNFPMKSTGWDSYNDWIRDLDWIEKEEFAIIINDFTKIPDLELKEHIIKNFEETVLPWWESEVLECVVEGETKKMMVYLVDSGEEMINEESGGKLTERIASKLKKIGVRK